MNKLLFHYCTVFMTLIMIKYYYELYLKPMLLCIGLFFRLWE